jgi:hypothetical protein
LVSAAIHLLLCVSVWIQDAGRAVNGPLGLLDKVTSALGGPPGRTPGRTAEHQIGETQALRDRRKELQCDVVRITEGQSRTVISIDDPSMSDPEFV